MRIVHLSYARVPNYNDPQLWLERISFYTGILDETAKQHETHSIHCINYRGNVTRNNVHYHFIPLTRMQQLLPLSLNRYINRLDPHVLILHGLHFSWQILLLCFQLKATTKVCVQHHAERPFRFHRYLLQRINDRFISCYFFASYELAIPWLKRKHINKPEKVIEMMEASSSFFPLKKGDAQTYTRTSGSLIYLWVGRLDTNKDPITLVKTFESFLSQVPHAKLYVIFQQNDLLADVKTVADRHPNNIHLVGKVRHADLLYWYNSADFIISTSHYEGSGIAVCEAMSCGCIPILTAIPSFRTMTKNGLHGLLFNAGDEKSLIAALQRSLTLDKEEMRSHVLAHFDRELSFKAIAEKMTNTFSPTLKQIESEQN